ncbi:hypothetical protein FCL40_14320 [Ferrimonas sediminicola]|uniref:Glutaredoxin domain-containing protein n=1 Tax=Ferrimonas sediminicola TaxID=2569538 RepID=A0A4U1BDN7_9GAMM|nr:glutaredoxin domain-containing protein [Ferrimonas sediminicola]TKB48096.1 hypothetical protein FCL40_14320 [Ferrimonas sediminicola]
MLTLRDQRAKSSLWPLLTNLAQLLLLPLSALALVVGLERLTHPPVRFQGDFSTHAGDRKAQVVIYNAGWCPASREIHSLLAYRGVKFEERDLGAGPTWLQRHVPLGCDSVPILLIGDTLIYGFKPKLIEQQLADEKVLP